ncbi:MAG: hypothetical protein WC114_12240 [Smithellaceae bacterium]
MTTHTITPRSMARRKLVAEASEFLAYAMGEFSDKHGELTPAEWVEVLTQKVKWVNNLALKEEWGG